MTIPNIYIKKLHSVIKQRICVMIFRSIFSVIYYQKYISHPVSKHYRSPAGTTSRRSTQKNIRITQKTRKNSFFKWHVYSRITERDSGYISTCIYLTLFRVAATGAHE